MTIHKAKWLLAGLMCLALWPAQSPAQSGQWESYRDAGIEAFLQGDYAEAEKQFAAAIEAAEGFGPEDPRLAESLNGLGEVNRAQGKFDDAERAHKRALAIREKAQGPGHPDVAQSLNNLAVVYQAQGKTAEVESLRKRALAIEEGVAAQARRWQSYLAAGNASYQQGRYADAERPLVAALGVAEGFGPQDPRLATSLNNLSGLYQLQGRYGDAEPLYKRSLAIREKALGPDHPHVAQSLENYADLLRKTGRATEASKMEARATAIRAKHAKENPVK